MVRTIRPGIGELPDTKSHNKREPATNEQNNNNTCSETRLDTLDRIAAHQQPLFFVRAQDSQSPHPRQQPEPLTHGATSADRSLLGSRQDRRRRTLHTRPHAMQLSQAAREPIRPQMKKGPCFHGPCAVCTAGSKCRDITIAVRAQNLCAYSTPIEFWCMLVSAEYPVPDPRIVPVS